MRLELGRLGKGIAVSVIEASAARAKDLGSNEGSVASCHVDDTRASKVDHADAAEWVDVEGGEEAGGCPDGADHHGVDEASEHDGVAQVGNHLAPLSDRTGDDGGGGRSERELEEPPDVIASAGEVHQEEVSISDEILVGRGRPAVREGVPDRPESEGAAARVEEVLEHDVLHVLLTDRAGAQHGKTRLHEEDEGRRKDEEEHIEASLDFANGVFENVA
mmetsp:Transcript_34030/g.101676  ORF Transcript_34030/g.101676 Transcript_34030/m.101676 type:complete len:219 (+) Transcript_34030:1314-1970(+)